MTRVKLFVALLGFVLLAAEPAIGHAGGLPWPVAGPVVLGFGERYGSGGRLSTHSGCDIEAPAGADVHAPCEAEVLFAGAVPAGPGEVRMAVTIRLADGTRVTFSPMEDLRVETGMMVSPGAVMGAVAPTGDPSSPGPHLHVSVRDATGYLDPERLFGSVTGQPSPEPAPDPEPVADRPVELRTPPAVAPPVAVNVPERESGRTEARTASARAPVEVTAPAPRTQAVAQATGEAAAAPQSEPRLAGASVAGLPAIAAWVASVSAVIALAVVSGFRGRACEAA